MPPIQATTLPHLRTTIEAVLRQQRKAKLEPETRYERGWGFERFVRENLATVMADRRYFGRRPKRVRKKLAKVFLRKAIYRHVGMVMADLIRPRVNYTEVARRIFVVEKLPDGALPVYDREP